MPIRHRRPSGSFCDRHPDIEAVYSKAAKGYVCPTCVSLSVASGGVFK